MTAEQILIALRNNKEQPRNIAQVVKAALDKEKAAPMDGCYLAAFK